jgi:hypothetical protein
MTPSAKAAGGRGDARLSRDDIIEAIRRWVALFGEPPVSADWNPSVARWRAQEWRIERYRSGDVERGVPWPSLNAVKRRFDGSFASAIRAAGFEPRRPGPARAAHTARPAVPPRHHTPPTAAEALAAALSAARDEVAASRDRAAAAERVARAAGVRAGRSAEKAAEARSRARLAGDRERRARAARDRAVARERAARADAAAAVRAAADSADARVVAAEDRFADELARAHERAAAAELRAASAEARAAEARADADRARTLALRAASSDGRRHAGAVQRRRASGPAGPGVLAEALTAVSRARSAGDRHGLEVALAELAAASTGWRERL